MHRFYAPGFVLDRDVVLPDAEAHHLSKVMRLKAGDLVAVFDGLGHEAFLVVENAEIVVRARIGWVDPAGKRPQDGNVTL